MTEKVTFGTYGKTFQEKVVQALLSDQKWAEQMSDVIDVEYFDVKYLTFLAHRLRDIQPLAAPAQRHFRHTECEIGRQSFAVLGDTFLDPGGHARSDSDEVDLHP